MFRRLWNWISGEAATVTDALAQSAIDDYAHELAREAITTEVPEKDIDAFLADLPPLKEETMAKSPKKPAAPAKGGKKSMPMKPGKKGMKGC